MCGIVGYLGPLNAAPVLLSELKCLEYRGYDSAGAAVIEDGRLCVMKAAGKLSNLEALLTHKRPLANVGIGHTRWATHGVPNDQNAHPHMDSTGTVAVVHNGIIENFEELKTELTELGYGFKSDTDSEVIAHLISYEATQGGDPVVLSQAGAACRCAGQGVRGDDAAGLGDRAGAVQRHGPGASGQPGSEDQRAARREGQVSVAGVHDRAATDRAVRRGRVAQPGLPARARDREGAIPGGGSEPARGDTGRWCEGHQNGRFF